MIAVSTVAANIAVAVKSCKVAMDLILTLAGAVVVVRRVRETVSR